ncbi:MAG: non-ribosomal peptide synthetase, partial [Bacillota bacterium]
SRITIGRPILNMRMYVLDEHQNFVPPGVTGEGYISGIGVGMGYINRETLTKEKFLPDPFVEGDVMYRTGDVCMLNASGELEMLGRVDYQVKIHGHRIELGEIEATIRSFPNIVEAVVKDYGANTDKYLAAYFSATRQVCLSELREYLGKKLPAYMIPSRLLEVDSIPLTANGKIDRKALPEPSREDVVHASSKAHEPLTKNERIMRRIWSRILGVKGIGPDDDFFALGGSSLDVIRVQAAVLQYNWAIRTQDFYNLKTLRAISSAIDPAATEKRTGAKAPEARRNAPVGHAPGPLPGLNLSNVLLTGVTGFLGAHILYELVAAHASEVTCVVRDTRHIDCAQRLQQTLAFYFGAGQADMLMRSIKIVKGDVSSRYFGMQRKEWEALSRSVSAVVHCAALTSHIGHAELFTKVNVTGTANVLAFCEQANTPLIHISTVSVSGMHYAENPRKNGVFTEDDYYIGQNYTDNEYVRSKFLAEGLVVDAMDRGLDARIFRVGNLTCRYRDAKYQINPDANAFATRIRVLSSLGCVPMGILAATLEMTPVDKCAQAIIALARLDGLDMRVFHMYNPHRLTVSNLVDALRAEGFNVNTVSDEAFGGLLMKLSRKGEYDNLAGIITESGSIWRTPNIRPDSSLTQACLSRGGFEWPRPDMDYIRSFIHTLLPRH